MITDFPENTQTDFVVPSSTFSKLAQPTKSSVLLKMGIVDIEYKRSVIGFSYIDNKEIFSAANQIVILISIFNCVAFLTQIH